MAKKTKNIPLTDYAKKIHKQIADLKKKEKAAVAEGLKLRAKKKEVEKKQRVLEKEWDVLDRAYDKAGDRECNIFEQISDLYGDIEDEKHRLPAKGAFVAYKKIYHNLNGNTKQAIVKLSVPATAKRVTPKGYKKSRVSEAVVISIKCLSTGVDLKEGFSVHDSTFKYKVGATVKSVEAFNPTKMNDCVSGIHCFLKENEARSY